MSILALRFLLPELAGANLQTMGYGISYILRYVLTTVLLFVGLTFSVCGKLTPKKTGVIVTAYFGMELFSNIFEPMQTGNMWMTIFQSLIYLICIVVIVGYYFLERRCSPIQMYCVAALGLIRNIFMYFQMIQLESDFTFIVRNVWLIAVAGYMVLIVYQTYVLEKKWRVAVKE